MKRNIAVVCGGFSGEHDVSLRSAKSIYDHIDQNLFVPHLICIEVDEWFMLDGDVKCPVDKSNFSATCVDGRGVQFDYAYITIHGTPGENGILQGYFDMIGLPYNTGGVLCESLTFNKDVTARYLSTYGVRIARSECLTRTTNYTVEGLLQSLSLPIFIKPNAGGSSIATFKVTGRDQVEPAIKAAFEEADEVLIEEMIVGTEVTCGCVVVDGEAQPIAISEVVAKRDFFDFDAKYNGLSDEITPARISVDLYKSIEELTCRIAMLVRAEGIVRVDYIIEADGVPTLLEVNTTPGMTAQSFIPQQASYKGLDLQELFTKIIQSKI